MPIRSSEGWPARPDRPKASGEHGAELVEGLLAQHGRGTAVVVHDAGRGDCCERRKRAGWISLDEIYPTAPCRNAMSICGRADRLWRERVVESPNSAIRHDTWRPLQMKYLMFMKHAETGGQTQPPKALMDAMGEF